MECPYLVLVIICALVTCEAQRSNNDIIWYPVEDEEGVFISLYGEKHKDTPASKWRSHRRARYTGMDQNYVQALPLSFDPAENEDFSFFHNINERRPGITNVGETRRKEPPRKPPVQGDESNLQGIFNEVFEYNKFRPTSSQKPVTSNQFPGNQWGSTQVSYPGQLPTGSNQWGERPPAGNQWGTRPPIGNQWGGRPSTGSQWGSNTQVTGFPRPQQTNQWGTPGSIAGDQWGSSRPNEWLTTTGNTNRPNRPGDSDSLVFPDETTRDIRKTSSFTTTTPSNVQPTNPPTMSPCERLCPVTPEFNPVCGSDTVTYTNAGRLKCAQMCGKDVKLSHYGNCGRTPFTTPLVSKNKAKKIRILVFK